MAGIVDKVVVIGFDGLEPSLVESMLARKELPNFAAVARAGGVSHVATTYPAQTPVAWSTFATGLNPGGHGIFDFLRRDAGAYLPQLALNRHEQKNPFLPPKAVNLRRGRTLWQMLSEAGIPSVVLRCPCMYPPENHPGTRTLAGMGVPDLRGSLGTGAFYTTNPDVQPREAESVVRLDRAAERMATKLLGPLSAKTRAPFECPISLEPRLADGVVRIHSAGEPSSLDAPLGEWSDWLSVKFKTGAFQTVKGRTRFFLRRLEPDLELYASPLNFDIAAPMFPISAPAEYAVEIQQHIGAFYTAGMPEEHSALSNGRIDEHAFLAQCEAVYREREAMLLYELTRLDQGLLFCLFDTPDRVQHMFWRFREADHPANEGRKPTEFQQVVEEQYRRCDKTLGKVLEQSDERTLVIALSDHGFGSFRRGVNLNAWLEQQGLLVRRRGGGDGNIADDEHYTPDEADNRFFRDVDWTRTRAYALGIGGIYLNRSGRERQGAVSDDEAPQLSQAIARELKGIRDPQGMVAAVRSVLPREEVYHGPCTDQAPDLLVNFAAGYRASWDTALGGVGGELFEDNTRRWSGDHIVDPALVPGVLLMNRPYRADGPRLLDMAPTILSALGADHEANKLEGEALLS